MTTYEPGTYVAAKIHGADVRLVRSIDAEWIDASATGGRHFYAENEVNDVRPLVVLDPEDTRISEFVKYWLPDGGRSFASRVAAMIEAQTKPPRIPEPGLYGVVSTEDHNGLTTYHWRSHDCWHAEDGHVREWDDLIDPTLIREGVES